MPIQLLVVLTVLQVSVPMNMSRELPLCWGVSVSVVVTVGVWGAILRLVVVSLVHQHIRRVAKSCDESPRSRFTTG